MKIKIRQAKMKIYFIRHGQAENNAKKLVSEKSGKLTPWGKLQARAVGKRFKNIPFGAIFTSPFERAQKTVKIITKYTSCKKIVVNKLLIEKKLPKEIERMPKQNKNVRKVLLLLERKNETDPFWHYSDEENFRDVQRRAKLFIKSISIPKRGNIMVVAHEYIIKAILFSLTSKESSYRVFKKFYHTTKIENGAVIVWHPKRRINKLPRSLLRGSLFIKENAFGLGKT